MTVLPAHNNAGAGFITINFIALVALNYLENNYQIKRSIINGQAGFQGSVCEYQTGSLKQSPYPETVV